jgi:ABC-type methionine transport system ATPase subunit
MLHRANHYPSQLSGGQRQRIGIARGLATQPSVLLADEATSGLDPETTRSILRLLNELRTDLGVTIVVITHEMDVVRSIADVVAHLDHGRIVEFGPVGEVARRSDSTLSTALLPEQSAPRPSDGQVVWHLRYQEAKVDPSWLSRISRELDTDIALLGGLVETVGSEAAGRLTVGVGTQLASDKVARAFAAYGIYARMAEAAEEFAGAPS